MGDLEIDQDEKFEQRFWKVERAGWAAMALLVVAALLGLFGSGPLSTSTAYAGDGAVTVEYKRFARRHAESVLKVRLRPGPADDQAEFRISGAYMAQMKIDSISPPPEYVRLDGNDMVFGFRSRGGSGNGYVTIFARPQSMGLLGGQIGTPDGQTVSFQQFVYP